MCGFCGYLLTNGEKERDTDQIRQMMLKQKHRGPDDSGISTYSFG